MAVKVVVSQDHGENRKVEEYLYNSADSWKLATPQDKGMDTYLEVIDSDNDRVVALFSYFDRVEVVDPPEDDEDED